MLKRMLNWLGSLLDNPDSGAGRETDTSSHTTSFPRTETYSQRKAREQHTQLYFTAMTALQQAVSDKDYELARKCILEALEHVAGFVDETLREYNAFTIQSIPPLEVGGRILALLDDQDGLNKIMSVIASRDQLSNWEDAYAEHEESRVLFRAIEKTVEENPGILQSAVKQKTGAADGRLVSVLISWLEKAGRIYREPSGKTYKLFMATDSGAKPPSQHAASRIIGSHRKGSSPSKQSVNWSNLEHIALPRSPSRWEVEPSDSREDTLTEPFAVMDSTEWKIIGVENLPQQERPHPAFRKLFAIGNGVLAFDDLGKSDPHAEAAVLLYDCEGETRAKASLMHGLYRLGVSSMSSSFIGLSKAHIAHAYNERLSLIFETDLSAAPEITTIKRRLQIDDKQLHTHIRSIALSDDASRYLYTVVDEAWCISSEGIGIWGLVVPLQDGYRLETNNTVGTRADIQEAMEIFGIELPFEADDVKRQYRMLAKKWHPDINHSPEAGARMQEINQAMSLLTGLEGDALAGYSGVQMAYKDMGSTTIGSGITMSMGIGMSEVSAADWLYASAFAASGSHAYIATYSGKVLEVDGRGKPLRYYSIGNVPRRIIDTGDFLYLLTDARLYVLHAGKIRALIDVSNGGDVVVAQTGFGLLENKRFRWYAEDGTHIATILSKSPIRRVYQKPEGVIVETRTQRLFVGGVHSWWES